MKILFVSHSFPFPIHEGIRLHDYHLLKHLSPNHEIHLLCFAFTPNERKFIPEIEPFCKSITVIDHDVPKQPWKRALNTFFQRGPFCLHQFYSKDMVRAVKEISERVKPDVAHFDHTPMAQYEQYIHPDIPRVFLPHDALSMLFENNARFERNPARKLYFWLQSKKLRWYEKKVLPLFDKTVVVSPVDREVLQKECPSASVEWSPNGVDSDYYNEAPHLEKDNVILFRGIMDFFPNHDAAMFFAEEVMPLLWKQNKNIEFWIVGHNPFPSLQRLAHHDKRIKTLGFVPDIRIPMAQATVIVCPMRSGSGIKNKTLESLAMAKAVVSTPMGLTGIQAVNEEHLLVGETPEELATQTWRLLVDQIIRRKMGHAGRRFVGSDHSWVAHGEYFNRIYQDVLLQRRLKMPNGGQA